jgi:DNA-binding MarR family transcriptional regulator/GNAT superfamily N-acetyltransferase
MLATTDHSVAAVRAFNRFYTNVLGLLQEGLLRTPYSLTEARVIYELGRRRATEVGELRRDLRIDAGYLSRMLARFEEDGLVTRRRSDADGRRQVIGLTARGRRAFTTLNSRSTEEIRVLLDPLSTGDRRRLIGSMEAVRQILEGSPRTRRRVLRAPGPGDYGWVVHRHGVLYRQEYAWNEEFEALVARIVADYVDGHDPQREAAWIAEADGEPVGCVFCMKKEEAVAQLRLLLVEPSARGMGVGTRLVDECVAFAKQRGYTEMMLWTNDVLDDARRIYERFGFRLVEEEKHHSFGHDLVGQNWWLDLEPTVP